MLKNYTLLSIIGEGSYGKVYLAKHTNNTLYAIKKYSKKSISYEDIILNACDHPCIQRMKEKYTIRNYNYLVLDYYKDGDLHEYLCKCSYFCVSEQQVITYMFDIIAGISYLHSIGVIHRDLKLENIMLHHGRPMICDFNLSNYDANALLCKIYRGVEVIVPDVMLDEFLGTIEYLAPEIVNEEPYNYMVDWWAFGIIIYEMLYSKNPYPDEEDVLVHIKEKREIPYLTTPIGNLSYGIIQFLSKLLLYDVRRRLGFLGGGVEILDYYDEVK